MSRSEKARQKASVKALGLRDAILAAWSFPKTISFSRNGHSYSLTVFSILTRSWISPADQLQRTSLIITGDILRDGVRLKHPDGTPLFPIEIYNPPCLIAGGGGTVNRGGKLYTYDLVALLQSLLQDAIAGVP